MITFLLDNNCNAPQQKSCVTEKDLPFRPMSTLSIDVYGEKQLLSALKKKKNVDRGYVNFQCMRKMHNDLNCNLSSLLFGDELGI